MKTIKIFLASSEELKPERLVIAELITKLNFLWAEYDISIFRPYHQIAYVDGISMEEILSLQAM